MGTWGGAERQIGAPECWGPGGLGKAGFWVPGMGRSSSPGETNCSIQSTLASWAAIEWSGHGPGKLFLAGRGPGFPCFPHTRFYTPPPPQPGRQTHLPCQELGSQGCFHSRRVGRGFRDSRERLVCRVGGSSQRLASKPVSQPVGGERRGGGCSGSHPPPPPPLCTTHLGGAREWGEPRAAGEARERRPGGRAAKRRAKGV